MSVTRVRARTLSFGEPGGPLVVLAHGLEDSWASWLPVATRLPGGWRLVALELPWRPGNDYRWQARPAGHWLSEGLDQLDAEPAMVVAHSFSANAVLRLLCAGGPQPRIPAAVLICPLYQPPGTPVTWRLFERARARFIEHVREGLRARMGARIGAVDPETLNSMVEMAVNRAGPAAFLAGFQEFLTSGDLALHNVRVPTLLIAGGADPSLSRDCAIRLSDAIAGAMLSFADDYDHFCHVRRAPGVAAALAEFLVTVFSSRTVGESR